MKTKKCRQCGKRKKITRFTLNGGRLTSVCQACSEKNATACPKCGRSVVSDMKALKEFRAKSKEVTALKKEVRDKNRRITFLEWRTGIDTTKVELTKEIDKLRVENKRLERSADRGRANKVRFLERANDVLKKMLTEAEARVEKMEKCRRHCLMCGQEFLADDPKTNRRCPRCEASVKNSNVDFSFFDSCEVHLK